MYAVRLFRRGAGHRSPASAIDGPYPKTYQRDARRIEKRQEPASSAILQPLLREAEGEVQEQSRLQGSCNDVAPEDCLIDEIQLAGVLQRVQSEGNQAEKIEMERRAGRSSGERARICRWQGR